MHLFEIKSLGGVNFVRPERILALQTGTTGNTVVVLDGGVLVQSSETTMAIAKRLQALTGE